MNIHEQSQSLNGYNEGAFRIERRVENTTSLTRYDIRLADTQAPATLTVLNAPVSERPATLEAFASEIRAINAIRQPGIAVVVGHGRSAELGSYVVYERLSGVSLGSRLKKQGPFSARAATSLLRSITGVMETAHAAGLVHGSLSLDNIMLEPAGSSRKQIKILGFGIAKLVSLFPGPMAAELEPVIAYASPEQCKGVPISRHSDIYSLGVLAYEMLYGLHPFPRGDGQQLINCHLRVPPYRPLLNGVQIPDRVEAAVFRALSKRPRDRFSSMAQFRRALPATMPPSLKRDSLDDLLPVPSRPVMSSPPANPDEDQKAKPWSRPARLAGDVVSRMVDEMISQDASSPPPLPIPANGGTGPFLPAVELDEELLPVDLAVEPEKPAVADHQGRLRLPPAHGRRGAQGPLPPARSGQSCAG